MSTAPKRKQAASEGGAEFSLTQFAADLGSKKGTDPMAPDQYLQFLNVESEVLRLWAWMLAHTIARGARESHQPFTPVIAVGTKGEPLTLKHAAADLDMELPNVHRAWKKLEKMGCVKKNDDGHLVLCGEFKVPKQKHKKKRQTCTDNYSARLQRDLAKLLPKLRDEYLHDDKHDVDVFKCGSRMGMGGWRHWLEQQQNARNKAFGLPVRRHERTDPAERARKRRELDLVLPGIEKLVQIIQDGIPYTSPSEVLQITKNGHQFPVSPEANGGYHSAPDVLSESFPEKTIEISKSVGLSVAQPTDRPTHIPINGSSPVTPRLAQLRDMLERKLAAKIQQPLPVKHLAESYNNLGAAPIDNLEKRINIRFPAITSWALIPILAREVGDLWRADPKGASIPTEVLSRQDQEARAQARRIVDQMHREKGD